MNPGLKTKSVFYRVMMELCQSCLVRRGFLNHAGTLVCGGMADMAGARMNNHVSVCGLFWRDHLGSEANDTKKGI